MKKFLKTLLLTLGDIEVKGKSNLDLLLGSMLAIEKMISQIEEQEKQEADDG